MKPTNLLIILLLIIIATILYQILLQSYKIGNQQSKPKQIINTLSPKISPTNTATPTSTQTPHRVTLSPTVNLSDCISKEMEQFNQLTPQAAEQTAKDQICEVKASSGSCNDGNPDCISKAIAQCEASPAPGAESQYQRMLYEAAEKTAASSCQHQNTNQPQHFSSLHN